MSRRFEGFSDRIKAKPLASEDHVDDETETPGDEPKKSNKKDKPMPESNNDEAIASATEAGNSAGFKAATDRMATVFASEHYQGREAHAGKLLTKSSLMSASAADIIDLMADMPKVEQEATLTADQQRDAAEAAAKNEMRAELDKNKNSGIDADGGKKETTIESNASIWDTAIAHVAPGFKK
jgi:hypothetical protein